MKESYISKTMSLFEQEKKENLAIERINFYRKNILAGVSIGVTGYALINTISNLSQGKFIPAMISAACTGAGAFASYKNIRNFPDSYRKIKKIKADIIEIQEMKEELTDIIENVDKIGLESRVINS